MVENIAVSVFAQDDLRAHTVPEPVPSPGEALVEIIYGGICGSDLHYWLHGAAGQSILKTPMVLGHEVVGTVLEPAADGSSPDRGASVTIHPNRLPQYTTEPWPENRPNIAPGCRYLGSAAHDPHTDGVFQRRVAMPGSMLRAVPDGVDLIEAALAEPAGVAWHGIERAGGVEGQRIAVVGLGPIGLLVVAIARVRGAVHIAVSDLSDEPVERAFTLGADARCGNPASGESTESVHADITFECSGSAPGLASAIAMTRRGGRVLMLGLQRPGPVEVPIADAIAREIDLIGSFRFVDGLDRVLEALGSGTLQIRSVVTHVLPATDPLSAFRTARDARRSGKVLLDFRDAYMSR